MSSTSAASGFALKRTVPMLGLAAGALNIQSLPAVVHRATLPPNAVNVAAQFLDSWVVAIDR